MSWPYHFISLSESDKLHRRELLDLRGYYAQWSVIIVIVAIRIFRFATRSTVKRDGPVSGNPRRYLVCGLWLLWLLGLSIWNSGDGMSSSPGSFEEPANMLDYLHLTKALGQVGLSQLPLQVLMSPANISQPAASSVLSVLTGIPQRALTPYHRLFGRVVVSLLLAHAALYTLFFVQSSHPEFGILLFKRVQDLDVQCGMAAIFSAVLLVLFVRPASQKGLQSWLVQGTIQERRKIFYFGHVSLVVLLCVAAYSHVKQAQKYMLQTLAASVLNWVCSWLLR
ncbi:hypothetical protein N7517_002570 [Penicillium concentricum]|uniref:Ferric oxidoreductase domain-containing protein n=1 Tax=Penicillium concentricum TaxID=293559 RepID=A0A9W9SVR2_9EURO|nr:uncharacterized protein N7517_002570 [Penicillium concentricum]KAJ5384659.1 hypothetical protein N7517_002570 [Penicillium concentricum]